MEIEAKFLLDEPVAEALRQLRAIGPYTFEHVVAIEQQHNRYFDTAGARLAAGRYGLRVRTLGDRRIATLKRDTGTRGVSHEREEWEAQIGDDDQPHRWPAGELRDRVLALIGDAPLVPILTIRTARQHIYAWRDQVRFAEISLDRGVFETNQGAVPFHELEVELLDSSARGDYDALVAALQQRFDLRPEGRSKLARGLSLLRRTG